MCRDLLGSPIAIISTGIFFSLTAAFSLIVNKVGYLKDRNWFSVEILFYLIFWILHFFVACVWYINNTAPEMRGFARHAAPYLHHLPQVVLLSACGGLAFALAFLWFSSSKANRVRNKRHQLWYIPKGKSWEDEQERTLPRGVPHLSRKKQLRIFHTIEHFATLISFGALLVMIEAAGAEFFSSSYHGAPASYVARVANLLFFPFFRIGFILWIIGCLMEGFKVTKVAPMFYYVSVLVFYLVLGDRGGVAVVGLSGIVLIGALRYKIRLWQLVTVILLTSVFFLIAGQARQSEERTLGSFVEKGIESQKDGGELTKFLPAVQHQAEVVLPALTMAVETVPEQRPYFYGYWSMRGTLALIPFRSKVFPFLSNEQRYWTSAEYMTWRFYGENPVRSGIGTTIIAESYLDFGLIGVVCAMFLAGILAGVYYRRIHRGLVLIDDIVFYGILTSSIVLGVRSGLASTFFRNVLWPVGAYFFLKMLARSFSLSRAKQKAKFPTNGKTKSNSTPQGGNIE